MEEAPPQKDARSQVVIIFKLRGLETIPGNPRLKFLASVKWSYEFNFTQQKL